MPDELPELNEILHSGSLAYGNWGKKFELKLAEYIGNPNIAVVNSFNLAMLVTLATFGIKAGDEVIASPMSCLASNQPFATSGVKVIWADIDPTTGTLCPDDVKNKITPKTKAIFHNHFCGYPGYIDEINSIARQNEVFVIDDAIEAFGSEYKGKTIGNLGSDATVYSFQAVRIPNTIDGGAIAFREKYFLEKAKRTRDFGIRREIFRDTHHEISQNYDISEPGYGATLSDVNSYIGCMQLQKTHALLKMQHNNAIVWQSKLEKDYPNLKILTNSFQKPNYWVFGILASDKLETILHFREKGFYASGVHLPNNYYSVFGEKGVFPGVNEFYSKFIALPCGWWL